MKKFYLFALAAMLFAACATDDTQDLRPVDAPETLTVGFEGGDDDTRVQLNSAGKTVWTKGDLVSVFYRSDANQQWQFQGETGERAGTIKRASAPEYTHTTSKIVVAYPYNENYYLNPETCNLQAYLPATQNYLADSYGLNGNIMVSSSEYKQFTLKSVCGWLKLQLAGSGEMVQSITLKGNNGEQVAGEIYIHTADATSILAAEQGGFGDDTEIGGTMLEDDTILTEVTLNCGNGVELGAEATTFYIALPPQTFEKGVTVEITTTEGKVMTKSTDKSLAIERNTIQPMATFEFINPDTPTQPTPANNEIWYTATEKVVPYKSGGFGANIVSNEWYETTGKGVITFDGEVTSIGAGAFAHCYALESINIPNSVIRIDQEAFASSGLKAINIPDSVTSIGSFAFSYCSSLTSVTIPNSVTSIGGYAFTSCTSLTSVTIPNGVTKIGEWAFYDCTSLTSVTIPDSVMEIGEGAFESCTSLKAFYGKFATTDNRCLIVNGTLNAFAIGCGATSYTIPNSVTSIGGYAFINCTSLTSVTIPDSVTSIGYSAFLYCTSLKTVYCKPTTPPTGDSMMFSSNASGCKIYVPASDDDSIINAYKAKEYWSDYADYIFEEVEPTPANNEIWYTATEKVEPYKSDGFGANIVSNEWYETTGKGVITFDGEVTSIGAGAFAHCYALESINIPNSVIRIGQEAFVSSGLKAINIPDSVTSIGNYAFSGCTSLTSITISDSVTSIGYAAFSGCESLTSVTIPDSVTSIGDYAFYKCTSLKTFYGKFASEDNRCLIVDGTLNAFAIGCGATSYTIPDSVTEIGNYAFRYCSSLNSVTIPDSVTEIGSAAFSGCTSLTRVDITDLSAWCKISFDDTGANPLCNGAKLYINNTEATNITIPSDITEIKSYAFDSCTSLTSITIPDSVTSIGDYAFRECTSLTSVTIGNSVTSIGDYAFWNCTSLKEVYCKPTTPPTGGSFMFSYNASGRKIYVPASDDDSIINAYKAKEYWSSYATYIFEYDFSAEL